MRELTPEELTTLAEEFSGLRKAVGLPPGVTLAQLIEHHRASAGLAAVMTAIGEGTLVFPHEASAPNSLVPDLLCPKCSLPRSAHAPSAEERKELVQGAVDSITRLFPNETAAWNAWNHIASSEPFVAAILALRRGAASYCALSFPAESGE